jgi:hypothetical protein
MVYGNFTSAFIATALISLTGAQADEFDGSRPLLCATMSAVECVDGSGCENRLPRDLDLQVNLAFHWDWSPAIGNG